MQMNGVRLFIRYGGEWNNDYEYVGGSTKMIFVAYDITYDQFEKQVMKLIGVDDSMFKIRTKCLYRLSVISPPWEIDSDQDLQLYLMGDEVLSHPICVTLEPKSNVVMLKSKDIKSISGSNQVMKPQPVNMTIRIGPPPSKTQSFTRGIPPAVYEQIRQFESICRMKDSRQPGEPLVTELQSKENVTIPVDIPDHTVTYKFDINDIDSNGLLDFNFDMPKVVDNDGDLVKTVRLSEIDDIRLSDIKGKKNVCDDDYSVNSKSSIAQSSSLCDSSSGHHDISVGQVFFSKKELAMKLSVLAMRKNFEFRVTKSNKLYYGVSCIDAQCKWRLRARNVKGSEFFQVIKYDSVHTCSVDILNHDHRQARSWVVGDIIKSKYEDVSRQYKPRDIIQDMRQNYGVNISYEKAWRARENAYVQIRGSHEDSYNQLGPYCEMLKMCNPGTVYRLELEDEKHFKYFFIALGPCIRGFLNCIRPVIVVDGTFLKGKFRGTLLVGNAMDGNNHIYPVAFGIVDRETDESWAWFFRNLKDTIGEVNNQVFISDRNPCISKAISEIFPNAFHGYCNYHLALNLKSKFKNDAVIPLFYLAARAPRQCDFELFWAQIRGFSGGLAEYLEEAGFDKWTRVFCKSRRYTLRTTNIAESMNALLKKGRELPITALIEHIRDIIQRWFWERRNDASARTKEVTEYADKLIENQFDLSTRMQVNPVDINTFLVKDIEHEFIVDLGKKECTCADFQWLEIPCAHAIAAARERNLGVYSLCSHYYWNECVLAAYAEPINPVGDPVEWTTPIDHVHPYILPPKIVRRIGRRKKERISSQGEARQLHKCGRCGVVGHNRQTCRNPISYSAK